MSEHERTASPTDRGRVTGDPHTLALDVDGSALPTRVAWGRVALFYAIALGGAIVIAVALACAGARFSGGTALSGLAQAVVALLYMPLPLVAGLIVERRARRRPLLAGELATLRRRWRSIIGVSVGAALLVLIAELAAVAVGGNLLGLGGVGRLVLTQSAVVDNLREAVPALAGQVRAADVPPPAVLYVLLFASGLGAGLTINGLFAYGEEYGWRGVLADELSPLGPTKANLLTGVMWGLWHAPLIVGGYNYGADSVSSALIGVVMMCAWVTPLSFILWRTRQATGSAIPAAVVHGSFNGAAGFFTLLVSGSSVLVGVPVGLASVVALSLAATLIWRWLSPAPASQAE